jgi:uncharacterized protein with beta-barrel porin domain
VADGVLGKVGDWIDAGQNILNAAGLAFAIKDLFKGDPGGLIPSSVSITVGGNGGNNGNADAVSVANTGDITTRGMESHAIFAQSIGGGGGEAQLYAKGEGAGEDVSVGIGGGGEFVVGGLGEFVIGGAGGAAGDGGTVEIKHSGKITTWGESANGIYAQSIGGGGGQAGSVAGGFSNVLAIGLGVGFGRDGGNSGNGKTVTVESNGEIVTHGSNAIGIFAQSIGGGGGIIGDVGGIAFAGSVGGNGSGGAVSVTHTGTISTFGNVAHGIFAQSAGGNSADGVSYLGAGGKVTVTLDGNITVHGANADGILAQSVGMDGVDNIDITVVSGTVQGGSGTGAAVRILNGADNTLTNHGTIMTVDSIAGTSIRGTTGNETINNYGTVTGSVDLGAGSNAFNNKVAATFNSGTTVNLGTSNTLTNAGTLSPGGKGTPLTTVLTGNFVQNSLGTFEVEVYKDGEHDKLHVNGDSASLDGTLSVIRGNGPYKDGTKYNLIKVTGIQGISGAFGHLLLPEPKPLLNFNVNQQSDVVEVEVHAPSCTTVATNRAERATANYLDKIMPTATGDLLNVLDKFQSLSLSQFGTAFSSLSPGSYDNFTGATYSSTWEYTQSLQRRMNTIHFYGMTSDYHPESKPLLLAFAGSDASLSQLFPTGESSQTQTKNGLWLNGYGQRGDQQADPGYTGFDYRISGSTAGFDHIFLDKLMVGLSLGYSRTDVDLDRQQGDGYINSLIGSLYGSYFNRNVYIQGALSYGRNWYHNHRLLTIGPIQRKAYSDHDGDLFSAYLGGGYYFNLKDWTIGPFGSLRYGYLNEEGFTEKGADSLNLKVDPHKTDSLVSELGLRVARAFKTQYGNLIPELKAAWSYDFGIDNRLITTSFEGSPGTQFSIKGQPVERSGAVVGAGLTFIHKSGFSSSIRYSGEFREKYKSHGVIGELRYTF